MTEEIMTTEPMTIGRRTIITSAAWSIPAVAIAVAAPAAATSLGVPTLEFSSPSLLVNACTPLTGVTIRLTTDGATPDPGKPVSVELPNGFTFATGNPTSFTGTTDNNGDVALPAIIAPALAQSVTLVATSGTLSASVPFNNDGAGAFVANFVDNFYFPPFPSGVTIKDLKIYTLPNGDSSIVALGSDGTVYRISTPLGTSTPPSSWSVVPALVGTVEFVAVSEGSSFGQQLFVSDGTTVTNSLGSIALPALPGGVTIVDLQVATSNANTVVAVLGSDGTLYRLGVDSTGSPLTPNWSQVAALAGNTTLFAVNHDSSAITTVHTNGSLIHSNTNVNFPALPLTGGATVKDMKVTKSLTGSHTIVAVLDTAGNTHSITIDEANLPAAPASWTTSPAFPGSTALIAANRVGVGYAPGVIVSDGTNVKNFAGGLSTPALPSGVGIVDLQLHSSNQSNHTTISVLGDDGYVYRFYYLAGTTTPVNPDWVKSTKFAGRAELIGVNTGLGNIQTVYAGTAC